LYKIHKICSGEDFSQIFIDVNGSDPLNNTPLMLAVKLQYYEEALVLIDHGADPKYRSTETMASPLE